MVFVDMDGVLADFEGGYRDKFGCSSSHLSDKKKLWSNINSAPNFFYDLPIFPDAKESLLRLQHLFGRHRVCILTACPKSNLESVVNQKKAWVRKHLGFANSVMFIPVQGGSNKYLYMQYKGDTLIDDTSKCIDPWIANGGVGILHTDWINTMGRA